VSLSERPNSAVPGVPGGSSSGENQLLADDPSAG
jgi:hypothetical protein